MPDGSEMPKAKDAGNARAEKRPLVQMGKVPAAEAPLPVIIERRCRGHLGGSALLLALISRARHHGRRVIPIDGDWRSKTLQRQYPPGTADGSVVPEMPNGAAFSATMVDQMSLMAEDRVSRVVDVSGGGSEIEQLLNDLNLPEFCSDLGIGHLSVCMLGPDREDFEHVLSSVSAGHLVPSNMLMVLSEYRVPAGRTPMTVFGPILKSQDYEDLKNAGAKSIFVERLHCMNLLREERLDFYEVAYSYGKYPAAIAWSTKRWLSKNDAEFNRVKIAERLP